MKKINILLSFGVLVLAVPAHSAIMKEKVMPQVVQKSQQPAQDFNNVANSVTQLNQTQTIINTPTFSTPIVNTLIVSTPTVHSYPKIADMVRIGTDIKHLQNVPKPVVTISNVEIIPKMLIATTRQGNAQIDVSLLDDFIAYASPMARHYPPVFINRTDRYNTIQRVKQLSEWLDVYAKDKNASYDVLLRATKLNAMARNLDLGSDYAVKANDYVTRALKIDDSAEANFLYGAMLAEGGGFDEGSKYLEKAERMGFAEASQSLAQADLLNDKKERAIQRLYDFKAKHPNNPYIDEQIRLVNSGEFYIWNILVK